MIPVVPISLVKHGKLMNYFSMVTTTGAPKTVAAEGLRLECLFPADEKTEARHADLIGARDRLKCDYLPVIDAKVGFIFREKQTVYSIGFLKR
jgi:hypothetical protein